MSIVRPWSRVLASVTAAFIATALVACSSPGSSPSAPAASAPGSAEPSGAASASPSTPVEPVPLTVGLGYIPSVQFAPFYLAQQEGWYEEAGVKVEFQNKIDPDLITLVGQGAIDIGIGDGTSVIPAVSQGIPIRYLATIYGQFPSIVFAKSSSGIDAPADLEGKKIGTPGRYGSSWIMLQAMLGSAGLTTDDVEVIEYPDFTQRAAVEQGVVHAATGFANNEPVQLELGGEAVSVLRVDEVVPLQGPGLIAGTETLKTKGAALAAFVATTLRAMEAVTADPELGLEAAIAAVPELASAREAQLAVLEATIETWRGAAQETGGLGALDREGWAASIEYLTTLGLVPNPVTVDDLLDEGFSRSDY